jgi:hypothetical protein
MLLYFYNSAAVLLLKGPDPAKHWLRTLNFEPVLGAGVSTVISTDMLMAFYIFIYFFTNYS